MARGGYKGASQRERRVLRATFTFLGTIFTWITLSLLAVALLVGGIFWA